MNRFQSAPSSVIVRLHLQECRQKFAIKLTCFIFLQNTWTHWHNTVFSQMSVMHVVEIYQQQSRCCHLSLLEITSYIINTIRSHNALNITWNYAANVGRVNLCHAFPCRCIVESKVWSGTYKVVESLTPSSLWMESVTTSAQVHSCISFEFTQ